VEVRGVVAFDDGSCAVTGRFDEYSVLGAETVLPHASYYHDGYIVRYGATGTPLWTRTFGSAEHWDGGFAVDKLSDGSSVVVGALGDDVCLRRYGAAGDLVWAHELQGDVAPSAGGSTSDAGLAVATFADDSFLVAASVHSDEIVHQLPGEPEVRIQGPGSLLLARFTADRRLEFTGPGADPTRALDTATSLADGCTYAAGSVFGRASFAGHAPVCTASHDAFVASYGFDGRLRWFKSFGGPFGDDRAVSVAACPDGGCVAVVTFSTPSSPELGRPPLTLDDGTAVHADPLFGDNSLVVRYDAGGTVLWVRRLGGREAVATDVETWPDGSCVVGGHFVGAIAAYQAPPLGPLEHQGSGTDVFLVRYGPKGNVQWLTVSQGRGQTLHGIATYADGACVVTGAFRQTLTLGTRSIPDGIVRMPDNEQVFVARVRADGSAAWLTWAGSVVFGGVPPSPPTDVDIRAGGVAARPDGSCVVAGCLDGTGRFRTTRTGPFWEDFTVRHGLFVASWDAAGELLWLRILLDGLENFGAEALPIDVHSLPDGDLVVAASFGDTVDVSGPLAARGGADYLVARFDPQGQLRRSPYVYGGDGRDLVEGVAPLADGSVVVAGTGDAPGPWGSTGAILVTRLHADGTGASADEVRLPASPSLPRSDGGAGDQYAAGLAAFQDGSFVVVGTSVGEPGSIVVDYAPGVPLVTGEGPNLLVARYRADGTVAWARSAFAVDRAVHAVGVASFPDGSCVVTGSFGGTLRLVDPDGVVRHSLPAEGDGTDVFLVRYDALGNIEWTHRAGGPDDDAPGAIAGFPDGSFVVTGLFHTRATTDPAAGPAVFGDHDLLVASAPEDLPDLFLARYRRDGTLDWARSAGGPGYDVGTGVTALPDGGCAVCGDATDLARFGTQQINAESLMTGSSFLARYDRHGDVAWVARVGTIEDYVVAPGDPFESGESSRFDATPRFARSVALLEGGGLAELVVGGGFTGEFRYGLFSFPGGGERAFWSFHAADDGQWRSTGVSSESALSSVWFSVAGRDGVFAATGSLVPEGPDLPRQATLYRNTIQSGFLISWTARFSGGGAAEGRATAVLPDGSVLVVGTFDQTIDVEDAHGTLLDSLMSSGGTRDIFIARLDERGERR
jgi:hypothetical protein